MKEFLRKHLGVIKTILGIILLVGALTGIFFLSEYVGNGSKDKEEKNPLAEEGQVIDVTAMKEMEKITYEEFKEYLKKKTTTVVMLGYESCYWCIQQKPILQMLMYEKDLDVKYLDVNSLTKEENAELIALHEDLEGYRTPTFISLKSKKVKVVSPNAKTRTQLIEMFKIMGVLE